MPTDLSGPQQAAAFATAQASLELLTDSSAQGAAVRAKLGASIAKLVGTREGPRVSAELRLLYEKRDSDTSHQVGERVAFFRHLGLVHDEVDSAQMKRMTGADGAAGDWPTEVRSEVNLPTLWRSLVRLAVAYLAAIDAAKDLRKNFLSQTQNILLRENVVSAKKVVSFLSLFFFFL